MCVYESMRRKAKGSENNKDFMRDDVLCGTGRGGVLCVVSRVACCSLLFDFVYLNPNLNASISARCGQHLLWEFERFHIRDLIWMSSRGRQTRLITLRHLQFHLQLIGIITGRRRRRGRRRDTQRFVTQHFLQHDSRILNTTVVTKIITLIQISTRNTEHTAHSTTEEERKNKTSEHLTQVRDTAIICCVCEWVWCYFYRYESAGSLMSQNLTILSPPAVMTNESLQHRNALMDVLPLLLLFPAAFCSFSPDAVLPLSFALLLLLLFGAPIVANSLTNASSSATPMMLW